MLDSQETLLSFDPTTVLLGRLVLLLGIQFFSYNYCETRKNLRNAECMWKNLNEIVVLLGPENNVDAIGH